MDVHMPEMDGFRTTRLIRTREKTRGVHIPIIAVTADALAGERDRCLAAGMDHYLSKPVRGKDLFEAIEQTLPGQRPTDSRSVFAGAGGQMGNPSPNAAETGRSPGGDWTAPLIRMGFDRTGLERVARSFLDTVPGRMATLARALADRDARVVQLTAHSLKGTLTVFAEKTAVEAAHLLEQATSEGKLEGLEPVLGQLQGEVARLCQVMAQFLSVP
jgi:DNA-binding response OmpR family regulator